MHLLAGASLSLLLIGNSAALTPQAARAVDQRVAVVDKQSNSILGWLKQFFSNNAQKRQEVCYEDEFYTFASDPTIGQAFCRAFMNYPVTTITVEYTPHITERTIISTRTLTHTELLRTTPIVTVTQQALDRRDDNAALVTEAPDAIVAGVFQRFQQRAAATGVPIASEDLSASWSSACGCQTYDGGTVVEAYTNEAIVETIAGYARVDTTVTITKTAGALTTTILPSNNVPSIPHPVPPISVLPIISSIDTGPLPVIPDTSEIPPPSLTTSHGPLIPTGMVFNCPAGNGTIISQMIQNERFDYLLMCGYDYPQEEVFYASLAYNSFAECAAACSMADALFDETFCQVAVYYPFFNQDGYNCFLNSNGSIAPVAAPGFNAAVLQVIAVGLDDNEVLSTEAVPTPDVTKTTPPELASAQMRSLLSDGSSTSLSIITPPPILDKRQELALTRYSTYISNGQTYSTGSSFTTYHSANGSWYYAYGYYWSVHWASATVVYAIGAQQTQIASSNQTDTYTEDLGDNGYIVVTNTTTITYTYYPGETVTNSTDTIIYSSYARNGTFITASTTIIVAVATDFYGSAGGSGSGGGGGAAGGGGGAGSGAITSSPSGLALSSSTEVFSTIFVTTISGGGSGGGAGGGGGGGGGGAGNSVLTTSLPPFIMSTGTIYTVSTLSSSVSTSAALSVTVLSTETPISTVTIVVTSGGTQGGSSFSTGGNIPPETTTLLSSPVSVVTIIASSGATEGGSSFSTGGIVPPETSTLLSTPLSVVTIVASSGATEGGSSFSTGGNIPQESTTTLPLVESTSSVEIIVVTSTTFALTPSPPVVIATPPPSSTASVIFPETSSSTTDFDFSNSPGQRTGPPQSETSSSTTDFDSSNSPGQRTGPPQEETPTPAETIGSTSAPTQSTVSEIPTLSVPVYPFPPYGYVPSVLTTTTTTTDTFTNTGNPRSGPEQFPPTSSESTGTVPPPLFSFSPSTSDVLSFSSGTVSGSLPLSSASISASTGLSTQVITQSGSSNLSFTNTGQPRTGPDQFPPTTSTEVNTFIKASPPVTILPSSCTACLNCTQGTTTVFTTVTMYGCYSQCPSGTGYVPQLAPQAFGQGPGRH